MAGVQKGLGSIMYGVDLPPYSQLPTTTHLTKSLELLKKTFFFLLKLMLASSSSRHFYSSTRPPAFSISSTNHQNTGRYRYQAHWDFLPKFLSLHYYTPPEGVLGVQRSGQAQGTMICQFRLLFFSQNGMKFKKPTKIIKIQ